MGAFCPIRRGIARAIPPRSARGLRPSLQEHVKAELARLGHKLDLRDVKGVGSVKAIAIHPKTGVLMGGVSPTGDSYVMGW